MMRKMEIDKKISPVARYARNWGNWFLEDYNIFTSKALTNS